MDAWERDLGPFGHKPGWVWHILPPSGSQPCTKQLIVSSHTDYTIWSPYKLYGNIKLQSLTHNLTFYKYTHKHGYESW